MMPSFDLNFAFTLPVVSYGNTFLVSKLCKDNRYVLPIVTYGHT